MKKRKPQEVKTVQSIPLDLLIPTPDNPRTIREDDPKILDLAESIQALGILQPGVARPHPKERGRYDLRAGARRHMAAGIAGLDAMPVNVLDLSDRQALEITVVENLQREGLLPLEEARAVQSLLDRKWTLEAIGSHIGKSIPWVCRRARLTKLIEEWRKKVEDPKSPVSTWPAVQIEEIAVLEPALQKTLYNSRELEFRYRDFHISLNELRSTIANYTHELRRAPWSLKDPDLLPRSPIELGKACSSCMTRTAAQPTLFGFEDDPKMVKKDRCLDPACWDKKLLAYTKRKANELKEKHGKLILIRGPKPPPGFSPLISDYEIEKCRKGESSSPCLWISGRSAGTWFWGKKRGSGKKGAKGKTGGGAGDVVERGDPHERERCAREIVHAQLAAHVTEYGTEYGPDSPRPSKKVIEFGLAHSIETVHDGSGSGYGINFGFDSLMVKMGVAKDLESFEYVKAEECMKTMRAEGMVTLLAGIGIFNALNASGLDPANGMGMPPPITGKDRVNAAKSLELDREWFALHRVEDLKVIAEDLGVNISSAKKKEDLIAALVNEKLPPGTMTTEIAIAFQLPKKDIHGMSTKEIREMIKTPWVRNLDKRRPK